MIVLPNEGCAKRLLYLRMINETRVGTCTFIRSPPCIMIVHLPLKLFSRSYVFVFHNLIPVPIYARSLRCSARRLYKSGAAAVGLLLSTLVAWIKLSLDAQHTGRSHYMGANEPCRRLDNRVKNSITVKGDTCLRVEAANNLNY